MEHYDKPYKTFDEMLKVLEASHGLQIPNREYAARALHFVPYYDLVNGYKDIWMEGDRFKPGTSFTDLFLFHLLDHDFQSALFPFGITIENYFKNILAQVIAEAFGVGQNKYLQKDNYIAPRNSKKNKSLWRGTVLSVLSEIASTSMDNPTLYYRTHHNHVPPWILLKNATFSQSINLFRLLRREQRKKVLDCMLPVGRPLENRYPVLVYALTNVRKCRNTIAHNLKFTSFDCARYMHNLDKETLRRLISPALLKDEELDNFKYLSGVYGYIMLSLSLVPEPVAKALMVSQIVSTLLINPSVQSLGASTRKACNQYYAGLNIPTDIETRLRNYRDELHL